MRNLIYFLYKYHTFLLFLLLEILSLITIYRYNNYQKASFLNATATYTSRIYDGVSRTKNYFYLRVINDSLMAENARLRSQMLNAYYESGFTVLSINDSAYKQQYQYIPAEVVNNSVIYRNNYLTLNKGSNHSINVGMGVITHNGVVGVVNAVSANYCTVLSLLNSNAKISATIKKNDAFGSLVWDGKDPKFCKLLDVNKHVEIAEGDEIVTSKYSGIFPQGLPIGRIKSYLLEPGDNFYNIQVELNSDFATLKTVYIIKNLLKEEQTALEKQHTNIDN
ncbi:MAG: rod shape-determining protein MreC [Bacteroidia bacterium]